MPDQQVSQPNYVDSELTLAVAEERRAHQKDVA
jgi:hypothetical protein